MKLSEIPASFDVEVVRDAQFRTLGIATHRTDAMLAFLESEKYLPLVLANPKIEALITTRDLLSKLPASCGVAITASPRGSFYRFHNHLATETDFYFKSAPTSIAPSTTVHPRAFVAERNVRIGERCVIEPNVTIQEGSVIGNDVTLRAGCAVGTHGFEFKRVDGDIIRVVHAGRAHIHDRVEVQFNSNVVRSVFGGATEVGEDTKIDAFVHVGHNVKVGKRCLIAAGSILCGSATLGDDVWLGPGSIISSELNIRDGARVTVGSLVTRDVDPGKQVTGNFAIDHARYLEFIRSIR